MQIKRQLNYPVIWTTQLFDSVLPMTLFPQQFIYFIIQVTNLELAKTS